MKYHITTFGCQMNKSDSERIAGLFDSLNYTKTEDETKADIRIINACSVRQSAIDRIFGKARKWNVEKKRVRRLAEKNKKQPATTILTGCILPKDKIKFKKKFDFVLNIKDLPNWPVEVRLPQCNSNFHTTNKKTYLSITPIYQNKYSAFVPIMTGCDNFCAYCAVPYTRGREFNRNVKEVLCEIKNLVKNGCLEITLLGQNVNTYRPKDKQNFSKKNPYKDSFAALLWEINQFKKLNRLHFTAPHPKDMTDEVIDALTLPKMVNYLHLPVQSGDDEILKRMNRNYTANDYLNLIKKIEKKIPNIALGTDIIAGFPSETKKQFENTVKLYKKAQFDISYTAKYSPRPNTAAEKMEDNISLEEKKRRWEVLQKLMEETALKKNQKYKNKIVEVLVDKKIIRQPAEKNFYEGNSREYKRVRFYSKKNLVGKIVNVKIDKAMMWMLEGKLE
ncbi:MAG: tRNA (N6-isopentenyl adenosine(37)-C2)-methylthiotransferase MiaB [bacterium]